MEGEIELTTAGVSPLVGVLTLGVYRERPEADAGRNVRGLSDVGWLIHQAKYIRSDRASLTQDDALVRLAEALCEQIASHEIFAAATFIVGAPSTGGEGFSDQLTSYVSDLSEIQHAIARDLMPGGRSRKVAAAPRRYSVERDLGGHHAIVLDDVYGQGVTMRALAVAAMQAGASSVTGLAPVRLFRG